MKPGAARCPLCRARLRGDVVCSRCGADLTAVMRLLGRAHRLRTEAAAALADGESLRAVGLAAKAQRLHATAAGWRLWRLATAVAQQRMQNSETDYGWRPR